MKNNMKKLIFCAIAAAMALASCNKNDNLQNGPTSANTAAGPKVSISFVGDGSTRAFFDASAAAEPWEKQINTVTVFAFSASNGSLTLRRELLSSEVAAGSATIVLPFGSANVHQNFYVVANYAVPVNVVTETGLLAVTDDSFPSYNGTVSDVMTQARRSGGFTMSGSANDVQLRTDGAPTDVTVPLKRTVAKVAIRISVDPDFLVKYPGRKIKVLDVGISRFAGSAPVFDSYVTTEVPMSNSMLQVPATTDDKVWDNLFYMFPSGARTSSTYLQLTIRALFDADGNFATTADQREYSYTVDLIAGGNGTLLRNGYYRVDCSLKGSIDDFVNVSVYAADWESTITQSNDLGL